MVIFAGMIILSLNCGKEEAEIKLSLTSPQNIAIPFNGYYKLSTGDSVAMKDYTPKEYNFILKKGESASGIVYKDTMNLTDTLHFQILKDGKEEISRKVTMLIEIIQFQITAQ